MICSVFFVCLTSLIGACEILFSSKINLWIHPPTLYYKGSDDCHASNYTRLRHYVNQYLDLFSEYFTTR